MAPSTRQRAALAVVLQLAIAGDAALPGATIAQQAAAKAGAAGAAGGGGGKKVASAQGAKHYGLPIGSLIIPHAHVPGSGGSRFVKGADPGGGHYVHGYISQAKWVANEWKKHPHLAAQAAHQAVEAGTHRWVQVGGHQFAVHKGVDVHVPSHTDLDNPAAVAKAPKLFTHQGEQGPEHLVATEHTLGEPAPTSEADKGTIGNSWKQLHHAETPHKAVTFAGKHAAWVPHDWQVYKNTSEPDEAKHKVKFARDPQGQWHYVYQNGTVKPVPHDKAEGWAKNGVIVPDDPHADEHAEHEDPGLPPAAPETEGKPQPTKVEVGGVAVTKDELKDAVAKLQGSASTQIKGLLKGHPLAASDYGSVYKAELKAHPHLQVPPGTKKAHVPEAKNAFIHHLLGHLAAMSDDQGSTAAAEELKHKVEAQAEHAKDLTPHQVTVPKDPEPELPGEPDPKPEPAPEPAPATAGSITVPKAGENYVGAAAPGDITASKEDVQAAIDALNGAKSTAIKQVLKAKGSKLADVDYWSVIHEYQAAHPNTTAAKGTKQAHAPNAKSMFIAAMQEKLDGLAKADQQTGHDESAELFDLAVHGALKSEPGLHDGGNNTYKIAKAAMKAVANDHNYYAWGSNGSWTVTAAKPDAFTSVYYKVTPELKLTSHSDEYPDGKASPTLLWNAVHMWVEPPKEGEPAAPEPEAPDAPSALNEAQADAAATKAWKSDSQWEKLHAHIEVVSHNTDMLYPWAEADGKQKFALMLFQSHVLQAPKYMVKDGSSYNSVNTPPDLGSYAAKGIQWWEVKPDHQVILHNADGTSTQLPMPMVQAFMKDGLKPAGKVLDTPKEPEGETVTVGGFVYTAPAGSAVFKAGEYASYIRHPDGTWAMVDKYSGVSLINSGSHKSLDGWATGADPNVKFEAANEAAKKFLAASSTAVPLPKAPPPPDVKVYIQGKHAASLPAGTKVYVPKANVNSNIKYVKTPAGNWAYVHGNGTIETVPPDNAWDALVAGSGDYLLEKYESNGLPAAPEEKEAEPDAEAGLDVPEAEPEPTSTAIPALYGGEVVGEWPAGSVLYNKMVGSYQGLYAKAPDGKWYSAGTHGVAVAPSYKITDASLQQANVLEKAEPPATEELTTAKAVTELKALIKHGSVNPAKAIGDMPGHSNALFSTWQEAMLNALGQKKDFATDTSVIPNGKGFAAGWSYSSGEEHWVFKEDTKSFQHYPSSGDSPVLIPVPQVLEQAKQHIVPNSLIIDGKQYKFGWWKKPKGSAYIEIKANEGYANTWKHGEAAHGEYTYHAPDGSVKDMTPAAATKWLQGAEHHTNEPKPGIATKPVTKVTHAQLAEPGIAFKLYSGAHDGPHPVESLELHPDGSAAYSAVTGLNGVPEVTVKMMLKGGMILDQYGNSVVVPGNPMDHYHLFGGAYKTKQQLEAFKDWVESNWAGGDTDWPSQFAKLVYDDDHQNASFAVFKHKGLLKAFIGAKNNGVIGSGTTQRNLVYQLVKEMLAVPEMPEGVKFTADDGEKAKEPVFLKTLPLGIAQASDIFTFTQDGWAAPSSVSLTGYSYLKAPELKAKIAEVSAKFGDGKVVGTHLTMTKDSLVAWLDAWKKGDMQAVFDLDAAAGKVSPAHPGAPDSTATHHITWSPADPLQLPASKDIPGAWTDLKYGDVPAKEADNYLLAMHFQHGEYLQSYEKQKVVKAHRSHDQDTVDEWTQQANKRAATGIPAAGGPLEWTDGLKSAKPYTTYLEQQTPAGSWSNIASQTFVEDHQAELAPYAAPAAAEYGYTEAQMLDPHAGSWITSKIIQKWLDDAHAKEVAAQSVPVWKKVATGQLPSHGHEVWKAVREIPFTGEKSTWFVKPAPDGKVFRLEQEHAANLLGRLFGFKSAESHLLESEPAFGQLVQAQKAIPGEPLGQYTDMPAWDAFSPQQIADMAMEHALDAVLFNDDTSANNMIKTPDGHLVGIDKGRSWGNMGWKGTAGTSDMDSMTQLVYTKLYDAIRKGDVSKEVADQAYTAVIQRVRKMSAVPDASVRKLLEAGFAHRTTKLPPGGKEALIQKVLDQKNSLEHDFHKMWSKIYQDAGFGAQSEDFGPDMPWGETPPANSRWGAVVFNEHGQVLLREAKNHYGGAGWTFAKGGANPGETPMQAAIREGAEETKYKFTPVAYVPGSYGGQASTNYYYLATAKGAQFTPELDNGETEQTKWVSVEEAKELIASASAEKVAARDLAVLQAAAEQWGDGEGMFHAQPLAGAAGFGSPLPLVPVSKLPEALGGHKLYAGFSEPGLMEYTAAGKSHGVPAFFGGPELRDMHVLLWQSNDQPGGGKSTHGETFLKGDGYDKVLGWLQKQAGKDAAPDSDDKETVYTDGGIPGRAPANSPDRGGIANERALYNTIITAARTVTRHKSDGLYNATALENLDQAAKDLDKLLPGADAVLSSLTGGGLGKEWAQNVKEMVAHYQDLIGQVRKAKEGAYGFTPGQLPRWLPSAAEPQEEAKTELEKLGIKVTYGHSSPHPNGKLSDDHELTADSHSHSEDPGKWYHVTLPDGETIEVGNGTKSGVALVHHGRLRFTTTDHSAASLERVRSAMQLMGLSMKEAESGDFEKFYWRHMLAMLDDRSDGHYDKQQEVWNELKNQFGAKGLAWGYGDGDGKHSAIIKALTQLGESDPEAENDAYRHAFAKLTSEEQVADWADRGGFLPHLKHFDPNNASHAGGKPDWYRFDLADKVKSGSLPAPIRQSSNSSKVAAVTVKSGGTYGRDALMRVAGTASAGLSNPYSSGGPGYVFTRLNVTSNRATVWSPLALARSHNYSFSDDSFGEWNQRKASSPWHADKWSKYTGGSNETMINDALSVLDDLELVRASGEVQRQELIKYLKDRGVTHIRFMPVEDRIVAHDITETDMAKIKANWKAHPELLDPLAEPYIHTAMEAPPAPALDTSASAAASKPDPHVDFIHDLLESGGHAPKAIYQAASNSDIYYAQFPSGNWVSFEKDDSGSSVIGPTNESEAGLVENLDAGTTDGSLKLLWGKSGDGPKTSKGKDWVEKGGYSAGVWQKGNDFKIVKQGSSYAFYHNTGSGWDDPALFGMFDTLEQAQQQA